MKKFSLFMLILAILNGSPSKLSGVILVAAITLLLLLWEEFSYNWTFRKTNYIKSSEKQTKFFEEKITNKCITNKPQKDYFFFTTDEFHKVHYLLKSHE